MNAIHPDPSFVVLPLVLPRIKEYKITNHVATLDHDQELIARKTLKFIQTH
ncbi:MAG: hypothetical protein KJP23_28850 [Deltaproteobacteria bacterium]|nr:hypothetical protein [Deltaproteobacteria bacterium]